MKQILVIDNYDSFTYNLVHALRQLGRSAIEVRRNDQLKLDEVAAFDGVVFSPGPGIPKDAGLMPAIISSYAPLKSMLGICLGHQAIGEVFGAKLINMERVIHGKATAIRIVERDPLFNGLPQLFRAGRYHSWVVDRIRCPRELSVLAEDEEGNVMAIKHKAFPVWGVQFHPESILTEFGHEMLSNWLGALG